ncbi:MAG: tetratricopeptide repeat protein [Cyanobacteria bacterium P01_A01_bin.135]
MAHNRLLIEHVSDQIRLSWQRGQGSPRFAPEVPFTHPFDAETLGGLRWYLEEYLRFPYGLAPDKAVAVEGQFEAWGQQLFALVFQSSDKAREFYQEATRDGLDRCEVGIASDNPQVLNLPWELMHCPDEQFLAPKLAGMYRSLSEQKVRAELPALPNDKLNILLVIARPYQRDVGFHTIARPILEALKPIRQYVSLKVLRPPTFAAFEQELNTHRDGFYHIVHFDGHGTFDPEARGPQYQLTGETGQGQLVFETLDGKADVVNADRIAQSLMSCRVPVFVLNACKSAQEGGEKFSSVATRFVAAGAQGVVAMAYSVYAEAAKQFMGRFYGELVRGSGVSEAVAAGRLSVLNAPQRQSPRGERTLKDWMVPVLYRQQPYVPFTPRQEVASFAALMAQAEGEAAPYGTQETQAVDLPEAGTYGFVGRDYDILRLERAFRQNSVALLKGMGGVGKTQLAIGFARWLADTQGRTGGTFFTSFEGGATLSNVVNQIGRALGGDRFTQLMAEQQEAVVLNYLQQNPCLLVWDNLEPVAGFPAGNEPLLNAEERGRLTAFLKAVQGSPTWVLVTSRREEPWLDCGYALVALGGLARPDAEALAAKILQTAGVDRGTLAPEYLELFDLLGGHPLSLRVVLPHLKRQTPEALVEALRRGLDTFSAPEEEGREKSLVVSLDYSFAALSEKARRHLPFLGLFTERVGVGVLDAFSGNPDDEDGQAYRAVFGENLQKEDWLAILREAEAASIVELLGDTVYKLHPTLPWYLRQRLEASGEAVAALEKKLLRFYGLLADNYRQRLVKQAELARFVLRVEEPNLLRQLRFGEQQDAWSEVQFILQAIGELYGRTSRKAEFLPLKQRALRQVGLHLEEVKTKGKDAFDLWTYIRNEDANDALAAANLDGARAIYQEILDELTALDSPTFEGNIAVSNHQLGTIAQEQRRFDEAIAYYSKALQIREAAGDHYRAADDYHQLGNIAYLQRRFDEAIADYTKALETLERAGDMYTSAREYHQLGMVAQEQRRFDEAVAYYQKALQIYEAAGDHYKAANGYHQLGIVAEEQRRFDEAVAYYQKALQIREVAGDHYKAANGYHQLGNVAYLQRRFDEAVAYYQKALQIKEAAGDHYNAASDYHHLGMVAQEQRRFDEAIGFFYRSLAIFMEAEDDYKAGYPIRQLGKMFKALGEDEFKSLWKTVIEDDCPEWLLEELRKVDESDDE